MYVLLPLHVSRVKLCVTSSLLLSLAHVDASISRYEWTKLPPLLSQTRLVYLHYLAIQDQQERTYSVMIGQALQRVVDVVSVCMHACTYCSEQTGFTVVFVFALPCRRVFLVFSWRSASWCWKTEEVVSLPCRVTS